MATFKDRINQLYDEAKDTNYKLTQENYASQFRATRNQLKGWLDGRGEPNSEMMKKIAKVHNVSVSWLVGETDIRTFYTTTILPLEFTVLQELPPAAIEQIKEYIELISLKYKPK